MTRLLCSFIAVALTSITSFSLANASTTASSTTSSPASTPSGVEVDVIFPAFNATYNITKSLPIVFVLQNLAAAAPLGPFFFTWGIMPWGGVGGPPAPGGVTNDFFSISFSPANITNEPIIIINQTDVQKWEFGPNNPVLPYYPDGSVYALQWGLQWEVKTSNMCASNWDFITGQNYFNINLGAPEPDLQNVTGQCAQQGSLWDFNPSATNRSCKVAISDNGPGDPCAVKVDDAVATSISSVVQSIVTASAAAASASSASWYSRTRIPPPQHNMAVNSDAPLRYVVMAMFLLGGFEMVLFSYI